MVPATPRRDPVVSPRAVQLAIVVASLVMLAGLLLPGFRTWRQHAAEQVARRQLESIRDGILQFMADTGLPPTRARNGDPRGLFRLLGPGLIAEGTYYFADRHQGSLVEQLAENTPQGRRQPGYEGWRGPYVRALTADPWGFAVVVVVYPLAHADDRDCVIVSAGPNGRMDATYSSPRDVIAAGDDVVVLVADKSPLARSPLK